MTPEPIVCFAKDWDGHPTSNTHVMRLLARTRRVLWLESIAMRAPRPGSARDLRRIGRRLRAAVGGPRNVEADLWVASPLVLPLPHAAWATQVNHRLLALTVRRLCARLGMPRFQVWTFLPTAGAYAAALGGTRLVYYCVDDWAHSPDHDGARVAAAEADLCRAADVVFATSSRLADAKRRLNPHTVHAPHGVDHAHFARALDPVTPVAPAIAALRPPVLVVVGLLDWRLDRALLAAIADRRPDWTLALVGPVLADLGALAARPNVHVLGPVPYAALPGVLRGCAVGLVPFVVTPYTRCIDPVKLREYRSAGLPVVASDLSDVAGAAVAHGPEEFVAAVERALAHDGPAARARRSAAMRDETWEARVRRLEAVVDRPAEAAA
jgi:glycosyltransferase involved in cell wall biosynthesis